MGLRALPQTGDTGRDLDDLHGPGWELEGSVDPLPEAAVPPQLHRGHQGLAAPGGGGCTGVARLGWICRRLHVDSC